MDPKIIEYLSEPLEVASEDTPKSPSTDAYSMMSDDELNSAFEKWLPSDVTYIGVGVSAAATIDKEVMVKALTDAREDASKTKIVIAANLGNHFGGFAIDKVNRKIFYFDPAPQLRKPHKENRSRKGHLAPINTVIALAETFPDIAIDRSTEEMQPSETYNLLEGVVVDVISNNRCGAFVWFVLTGLAMGKISAQYKISDVPDKRALAGDDKTRSLAVPKLELLDERGVVFELRNFNIKESKEAGDLLFSGLNLDAPKDDAEKIKMYDYILNSFTTFCLKAEISSAAIGGGATAGAGSSSDKRGIVAVDRGEGDDYDILEEGRPSKRAVKGAGGDKPIVAKPGMENAAGL